MQKNAFTTIIAILLILYSLTNFGAAIGQFGKAKTVSGTSSMAASLGNYAGDKAGADKIQREGATASGILYLIAIFILVTAVLDVAAAIGLFGGQNWAFALLIAAALFGILVEIQDIAEDGFGVGKIIFLTINGLALIAAGTARRQELVTQ